MEHNESGITVQFAGQFLEKVMLNGLEPSLVAGGDGTEVVHHRLAAGTRWAMIPEEGWSAFEFFYILSGRLIWKHPEGDLLLKTGDSISASPVKTHAVFIAETDVEFLYICSQPVFHYYSESIKEKMDLAVAIEQKDGYTGDHCQRIKQLSMMIGEAMALPQQDLVALNFGAFLHDVGKVRIPQGILGKPGKLTDPEWEVMKLHTVYGHKILEETNLPHMLPAGMIIKQHHERCNGSGYPNGLQKGEIGIGASIVAVVDSYDAMITDRVYRAARSREDALLEIKRCRESLYHPEVVDTFLSLADKFV